MIYLLRRSMWRLVQMILLVLIGLTLLLLWQEQSLIYHPAPMGSETPKSLGLDYQALELTTRDGERIQAWFIPAPKGLITPSAFTLLFFHGNAGNMSMRLQQCAIWNQLGLTVMMIDYRGFGGSSGSPDEAGLNLDAEAAWQYLMTQGIKPDHIIIAGRSLGSGVATALAARYPAVGLVLETPFTSIGDLVDVNYPWLPHLRYLTQNRFDNASLMSTIDMPVMVIAAEQDQIMPAFMPHQLYKTAPQGMIYRVMAGDHNNYPYQSQLEYQKTWQQWITLLAERKISEN